MKHIIHLALIAAGALYVLSGRIAARGDDPASSSNSTYDGQWSLEFGVATKPGGETTMIAEVTRTINLSFQAVKSSFQVDKSGTFAWEEREHGLFHSDQTLIDRLGHTAHPGETQQPVLRAKGQVVDKETRALKLTLEWTGGNGSFVDGRGGGTLSTTADPNTITVTGVVSGTAPWVSTTSKWELKPSKIERQDLGPDEQREVVTYKARRTTNVPFWLRDQSATEHIEVIQVRQLKLVPRG